MVELTYSPKFKKAFKKLNKQTKNVIIEAVDSIQANPFIGKELAGDLAGVRSYDFKINNTPARIAYECDEFGKVWVFIIYFGSRENFYDELRH